MTANSTDRADRDPWWAFFRLLIGSAMHLGFRLRFRGLENLPARGGAIVAPNHVSVFDPIVVALGVSRRNRIVRYVGTAEVFVGIRGWVLRRIRQIPIVRGAGDVNALEGATRVIRAGGIAGIYPEGRIGPGDALLPGRRGAARLALASGGPLIPVGIWGTNARWSQSGLHRRRPWRPIVAVCFGPPIEARGDPTSDEDLLALTDRLMVAIGEQVAVARRLARVP